MGASTDGIIFFGWVMDEDVVLPWEGDKHDGCHEDWWRTVSGYKPPFEIWNAEGEYLGGVRPPEEKISEYYSCLHEWQADHPLPFEVINYCSGECPMWAIAVPGVGMTARRGYPEVISGLPPVSAKDINAVADVLRLHEVELEGLPDWHLASYWG